MAWEEESIESGVDFEEVGGKKSKLKLIIIVVVLLAVLGGAYFAYTKFMAKPDTPEGEDAEAAAAAEAEEPEPEPVIGHKVDLEKMTINLSGAGGGRHYLVCKLALEVTTPELKTALEDPEDTKLYMAKTVNAILEIMREKTYEEVRDSGSSRELAQEIRFKLSRLYTEGDVMAVYFSEFLID